jgi:hypothetical protein
MVQIWLLCLVPQGRVRVHVSSKSGLNEQFIDYSNIAGIDFSVKVLDALTEVQKMAKPENWEVLRPYAEKLLNQPIPPPMTMQSRNTGLSYEHSSPLKGGAAQLAVKPRVCSRL